MLVLKVSQVESVFSVHRAFNCPELHHHKFPHNGEGVELGTVRVHVRVLSKHRCAYEK